MAAARITWQEKTRRLIGWPKKGVCARFARSIKEPERTVYGWLRWNRSPHDEADVLAKIASARGVTVSWLTDGKDGPPPLVGTAASRDFIEAVERSGLPEHAKRLVLAVTDPDALETLSAFYEQVYLPRRRRRA